MSIEAATLILAVVTTVMAIATASMAYLTRDVANETKQSTKVAADSLAHAKAIRLDSLRPHLVVLSPSDIAGSQDEVRFQYRDDPIQVSPAYKVVTTVDNVGHAWYSVPFKNIGLGPARIESFQFRLGPHQTVVDGHEHLTDSVVSVGGRTRVSFATTMTSWRDASTYPCDQNSVPVVLWDCHLKLCYTNIEKSERYCALFAIQRDRKDVITVDEISIHRAGSG